MPKGLCRLLIVDDSPEDRTVVRLLLEDVAECDWRIFEDEKGHQALKRLEEQLVDCILLDYQLPDMNGLRFLHELNRRFGALHLPVVMLTGSGRAAIAVEAMKAGAQDYLSKDLIRADTLVRGIDNAMERMALLREQVQRKAELEATNARLRLLEAAVQATNESIVITDAELSRPGPRIVFVNEAFTRMTGYSRDEIIGKTPRILQGPNTDQAVLKRLRTDLESGRPVSGRTINYRKGGEEFVIDWAVASISDHDAVSHYVAIQRDATEKQRDEERVQLSEERLELALRGAELGLWDWEISSGRVNYDERWAAMLGYDVAEIEPTFEGWASLVHPEDLSLANKTLETHLRGETATYEAEFRMRTRDGEWRWILARGKVLDRLPDGCPRRALGTHLDITERRKAELALRRSNEDLEQFAHTVSHDLQEPLRMITAYSELLSRSLGSKLDDAAQYFLNTIQAGGRQASRLVTDLLEYSRAGAQEQQLMIATCHLREPLDWAVIGNTRLIEETGAVVEHDELPVVQANQALMVRLFQNLVSNALKYAKPGEPPRIKVTAQLEGKHWVLSVHDNGVGFDPDKADYIFGVFKRLDSSDRSGSGLGLAICRLIVERHGGRIWAESKPGVGSTFRFTLPAHDKAFCVRGSISG